MSGAAGVLRPGAICRLLLGAMDASEGRRQRRKRDTTPDRIGMDMKRALLTRAAAEDPEPASFEAWLLEASLGQGGGAVAMAREILEEWRLAAQSASFREWLERGAPSDDAGGGDARGGDAGGGAGGAETERRRDRSAG